MTPEINCKIVSMGDLVVDFNIGVKSLPISPDDHQLVHGVQFEPGGAGNFLIAGRHLGANMTALGVVGADIYGSEMLGVFDTKGIETRDIIVQSSGTTTLVFTLSDKRGRHVFLGRIGEGPQVLFEESWKDAIRSADAVHAFGYTLQETRLADAFMAAMKFAQANGVPVFFDPGPHIRNVPFEERQMVLRFCNTLILTEDEIPLLKPDSKGYQDARDLLSDSVTRVVVKRGRKGCVAFTAQAEVCHEGFKVDEVDHAGAGDSFAAALIIALIRKFSLQEALEIANAMGAAKVQKFGSGTQVPTRDEMQSVLGHTVVF